VTLSADLQTGGIQLALLTGPLTGRGVELMLQRQIIDLLQSE
jgi:hypothetical protein